MATACPGGKPLPATTSGMPGCPAAWSSWIEACDAVVGVGVRVGVGVGVGAGVAVSVGVGVGVGAGVGVTGVCDSGPAATVASHRPDRTKTARMLFILAARVQ